MLTGNTSAVTLQTTAIAANRVGILCDTCSGTSALINNSSIYANSSKNVQVFGSTATGTIRVNNNWWDKTSSAAIAATIDNPAPITINTSGFLTVAPVEIDSTLGNDPRQLQAISIEYYHDDGFNSPNVATNATGAVLWQEHYQPFGESRLNQDPNPSINYTGHALDRDTGLIYAGARYMDPVIGRFMSIDPVEFTETNPVSFNRYAYANNSPYAFYDPDGKDAVGIVYKGYMVNTGINNIRAPLGHAGVLIIDNASGGTKYYEFGRYDGNAAGVIGEKLQKDDGNIRNIPVSNVVIGSDGKPTESSLNKIYGELSAKTGQNKTVDATYHSGADYNAMKSYVNSIANDKKRDKYSLVGNTCYDFKSKVIDSGNKGK